MRSTTMMRQFKQIQWNIQICFNNKYWTLCDVFIRNSGTLNLCNV